MMVTLSLVVVTCVFILIAVAIVSWFLTTSNDGFAWKNNSSQTTTVDINLAQETNNVED